MTGPRVGSLCSGYGGLDMAAEQHFGATTAWHCEYDRWPSAVLAHRWPGVPNLGDITTADWSALEPVDILTAGYPCQPFSHAGKRQGTDDARHIWPHVAAAVRALRPRHVVLENVAGHLSLGFGDVLGDLAALGYDARWACVRAADVGAPHGRLRVFIHAEPADAAGFGLQGRESQRVGLAVGQWPSDRGGAPADAEGQRRAERRPGDAERPGAGGRAAGGGRAAAAPVRLDFGPYAPAVARWAAVLGRPAPAPVEPGRSGPRLSPAFVEWMMGLPDGWVTAVPGLPRSAQLKALGNGVVPQQAAHALALLDGSPPPSSDEVDDDGLLPTPRAGKPEGYQSPGFTPNLSQRVLALTSEAAEQ